MGDQLIAVYLWDRSNSLDRTAQMEGWMPKHLIWTPAYVDEDLIEIESGRRVADQSDSEHSIQLKCWAGGH
jgi:hypothetical protein